MNVVVEVLSILSIATKEMEQSLTSVFLLSDSLTHHLTVLTSPSEKYLKKLVGRTDIEDGLKKLDNLIHREHGVATAQVLKATSEIKDGV